MAGGFEEPFRLSFQADSLHSGSISFGRFEAESLSWERRSSFSHNRYLEEVERYSKPGSVTEKKAYFEAHFRKKALLSQSSSEGQNGTDYQTSENSDRQNMDYMEDFETFNEGNKFKRFDESSGWLEYDGFCETKECEKEDTRVLCCEVPVEPVMSDADAVDNIPDIVTPAGACRPETRNGHLINTETVQDDEVNDDILHVEATSEIVDLSPLTTSLGYEQILDLESKVVDFSPTSHTASLGHQQILEATSKVVDSSPSSHTSIKVETASETKPMKPKLKHRQDQKTVSIKASKDSSKKPSKKEEGSQRTKPEMKSSQISAPCIRTMSRASKPEDLDSKGKLIQEKGSSGKELRTKKVVDSQSLASEKFVPRARQTASRHKQTYLMKLGEKKVHTKEVEMNQIQEKTLEKKEADIKQFRRSLNFKATPMPSFYHESTGRSHRNKAVSGITRSSKQQNNDSSNPGVSARGSSHSYTKSDRALSAIEPVNAADPPVASGVTNSSAPSDADYQNSATNRTHTSEAGMNNELTGKREQEKKDISSQKHRASSGCKIVRGQKVYEKQNMGAGRSGNDMMRKERKGVDFSSGPKMRHVAVGVAS
ncbi:hypothetical protein RJ639_041897 [Escallonia herrerae]|uniref:TPX2 C-terminal domain-containing protein n=1 Tax=Escallonia herrerae TaxID=1293975 RepID=A0AA89B4N5_9ASTE|nr:hypothetical protein RJ639_041897 [Escallonia herrerae]